HAPGGKTRSPLDDLAPAGRNTPRAAALVERRDEAGPTEVRAAFLAAIDLGFRRPPEGADVAGAYHLEAWTDAVQAGHLAGGHTRLRRRSHRLRRQPQRRQRAHHTGERDRGLVPYRGGQARLPRNRRQTVEAALRHFA